MRTLGLVLTVVAIVGLAAGPAAANTIDFIGTDGGNISYAGGLAPLVGSNLPINGVFGSPPGSSSSVPVLSGLLNFSTGNFSGGMIVGPTQFISFYNAGGAISITGSVPAAGIPTTSTLLSGTFTGMPIFQYSGSGLAALNGSLGLTFVNAALSDYFDFGPLAGTEPGVIAQAEFGISFYGPPLFGIGFSGSQASVNIAVNAANPVTVPEATSLALVMSGIAGLVLFRAGLRGRQVSAAA